MRGSTCQFHFMQGCLFFAAMEFFLNLIHKLLKTYLPHMATTALIHFMPLYLFLKFLHFIFRSIFTENVAGKVVLITGASSGIGEHLAYEYAKKGARLVLVARRRKSLEQVADMAYWLGSPDVITVHADVSNVEDCQRLIEGAISNFGRCTYTKLIKLNVKKYVNYIPHNRRQCLEETLIKGKFLTTEGKLEVDQVMRDVEMSVTPILPVEKCERSIVKSACRGDNYLTEPLWLTTLLIYRIFFLELVEWFQLWFLIPGPGKPATEAHPARYFWI